MVLFLNILLCILKIIGIVILVVLGIAILLLCLLLFVPIRYKVYASFLGAPHVSAHVTYLLKLLHVEFELDGRQSELKIKIFGHNISDKKKENGGKSADTGNSGRDKSSDAKKAKRSVEKTKKPDDTVNVNDDAKADINEKTQSERTNKIVMAEEHKGSEVEQSVNHIENRRDDDVDDFKQRIERLEQKAESSEQKPESHGQNVEGSGQKADSSSQKTKHAEQSVVDNKGYNSNNNKPDSVDDEKNRDKKKSAKAQRKSRDVPDKNDDAPKVTDKIKAGAALLKENRHVLDFVFRQLKLLFKHILPGSHVVNIRLGLDDPALLGEILGGAAVLRAMTGLVINITPVWDEKVFEAQADLKGRIILGRVLFIAARVYFNKEVKKFIKAVKNI